MSDVTETNNQWSVKYVLSCGHTRISKEPGFKAGSSWWCQMCQDAVQVTEVINIRRTHEQA